MTEKKPWYKSKIALLGLGAVLVFGSNLLSGWLTNMGVTQEQLDALSQAAPQIQDAVETAKEGGNWLSVIGAGVGALVFVFRKWFTTKLLV